MQAPRQRRRLRIHILPEGRMELPRPPQLLHRLKVLRKGDCKMKLLLIFAVMLIAAAFLTGCAPQAQEASQPAPPKESFAPKVIFEVAPGSATEGQEAAISWMVTGDAATTPHTAVHYGPASVPNPTGPQDYPQATTFQCETTPCSIPASFSAALKIDEPGTHYYRAHAIINRES